MRTRSAWLWGLALGATLLLIAALWLGRPATAPVSGTVRVNGQPLDEGWINFFVADAPPMPGVGAEIRAGKYHLAQNNGATVGKNRVEIRGLRKTGQQVRNDRLQRMVDLTEDSFPPENGKFVITVVAGSNDLDFDVSTAPK